MRKVFMIAIAICICIFIYLGAKNLGNYLNELSIMANDTISNNSASGNFTFKKTPENIELVNSYINVNDMFIDTLSKNVVEEKTIENSDNLIDFFPTFKMYYSAKLKIQKAMFDGIPYLLNNAISLSENDLETFYNNKSEYLSEYFGINKFEEFSNIIITLSYLKDGEFNRVEIVENSLTYNPYGKCTLFKLKLYNDDVEDFITFTVNAYLGYNTKYQKAPVIVIRALGGMS